MNTVFLDKETNEVQRVLTLQANRNKRHRYQEFVIEGRLALDEASDKGWNIRSLFYSRERPLSDWARRHLERGKHLIAYALSDLLMKKISDKTDCSELVAIVEQPIRSLADYQPKSQDIVVVLDEPKSPGNLGMMIRSSVAFGVSAVIISGHGADEFDPQCIRASCGTFFSLPIYRTEGIKTFSQKLEEWAKVHPLSIIASGNLGSIPLSQADLSKDVLFLILGNETEGVSVGYQQIADQFVQIPLDGEFTSLNIAAAGSIFLYEILRQRKM